MSMILYKPWKSIDVRHKLSFVDFQQMFQQYMDLFDFCRTGVQYKMSLQEYHHW